MHKKNIFVLCCLLSLNVAVCQPYSRVAVIAMKNLLRKSVEVHMHSIEPGMCTRIHQSSKSLLSQEAVELSVPVNDHSSTHMTFSIGDSGIKKSFKGSIVPSHVELAPSHLPDQIVVTTTIKEHFSIEESGITKKSDN